MLLPQKQLSSLRVPSSGRKSLNSKATGLFYGCQEFVIELVVVLIWRNVNAVEAVENREKWQMKYLTVVNKGTGLILNNLPPIFFLGKITSRDFKFPLTMCEPWAGYQCWHQSDGWWTDVDLQLLDQQTSEQENTHSNIIKTAERYGKNAWYTQGSQQ